MTTFNVDGVAGFTKALKAAQSGDTIALAAGTYSGLTIAELKVSGITITSQDPAHEAILKNLLVYNANGLTFTGLEFSADAAKGDIPFKVAQSTNITFDHLNIHGSLDGNAANDVNAFAVYKSTGVTITNSEIQQLKNVVLDGPNDQVTLTGNSVHDISGVAVKTLTDATTPATDHPTTGTTPATGTPPTTGATPTTDHPTTGTTPPTGTTPTTDHPTTGTTPATGAPATSPTTVPPVTDHPTTGTTPTPGTQPTVTPSTEPKAIVATDAGGPLDGTANNDIMKGGKGADELHGKDGNDLLTGGAGNDTLFGDAGNDTLSGGDGNDVLQGGSGLNTLIGGGGADVFAFKTGDFANGLTKDADLIVDFSHAQGDKIDLSGIDAVAGTPADEAFTLIGSDAFHKVAGELRYEISGKNVLLLGDTNGDGIADVKVLIANASGSLAPGDLIL